MNVILKWLKSPVYPASFPFNKVTSTYLEETLNIVLRDQKKKINLLLESKEYSFENFLHVILKEQYQVQLIWGIIVHLKSVLGLEDFRMLYERKITKISVFFNELNQDFRFIAKVKLLQDKTKVKTMQPIEKKILDDTVLHLKLKGSFLNKESKKKLLSIEENLHLLSSTFSNNILDETESFVLKITEKNRLKGIPDRVLEEAWNENKKRDFLNKEITWAFTLHSSSYNSIMKFCQDEKIRQAMYKSFHNRCSKGIYTNKQNVLKILNLRLELAKILGFKNYAEYSLQTKMLQNPKEVVTFLKDLYTESIQQAKDEYQMIVDFKKEENKYNDISPWDISFYSERLKERQFKFSEENLNPYLPLVNVLKGIFKIVHQLYGVIFTLKKVPVWHDTVIFYEVSLDDKVIAGVYFDLHTRKGKQEGAWMDEQTSLYINTQNQKVLPVAYVNCNFSPFNSKKDILLNYDETETLFHEMGHALHHVLTKIEYLSVSGIAGVSWDAVEVPSQFFENWIWNVKSVQIFSKHYQHKVSIPSVMIEKLIQSRKFLSAMQMLRQLELSMVDIQLHLRETSWTSVQEIDDFINKVREPFRLYSIPSDEQFYPTFSHIFSGEYAAGYYSYQWAEVLSADCFSLFKQKGLFNNQLSRSFLNKILSQGGSKPFMELFKSFRGKKPSTKFLLFDLGINL